jgi:pyrimidine-nucleoside phosphorylase
MYDLIVKKRNGEVLEQDEITFMIEGFTNGTIPDYQMSAMMMAIFLKGMNDNETLNLTMAMAHSGDVLDLSNINGLKADKHSTGGVGDKTSLVLGPMVAALGVPVAKMSGRGLGHTGGTIDKLESFKGFSVDISTDKFIENVNTIKMAIIGQTADLAPADKKLYALRDVTATVDNMSLIASSIMSKKLAAGADTIVLDVKTGSGAFMKTEEESFALAKEMVQIGNGAGRHTVAIVSDMDQPLGFAVGNALEVKEAIDTLNGEGSKDLLELCVTLGAYMLIGTNHASTVEEAKEKLYKTIEDKSALNKFAEFIEAQGGDSASIYDTSLLPKASIEEELLAEEEGYVNHITTDEIGMVSLILGGGRETKESEIDLSVGLVLRKKVGDYVEKGESLATIYANDKIKLQAARDRFKGTYFFTSEKKEKPAFIKGIVE